MRYITVCDWENGTVTITKLMDDEYEFEAAVRIGFKGTKKQEWISTETLEINI